MSLCRAELGFYSERASLKAESDNEFLRITVLACNACMRERGRVGVACMWVCVACVHGVRERLCSLRAQLACTRARMTSERSLRGAARRAVPCEHKHV